jgi:hypothetical protein
MFLALVSPIPLFLFGLSGSRTRSARWVFLFVCALAMVGCGTSFTGTPGAKTEVYTITVTASGTSAPTHSQTFALTLTQ